jgi:hypothetical protein
MNLYESAFIRHSAPLRSLVAISVHTLADTIHKMAKRKQKKTLKASPASPSPLSEPAAPDTPRSTKSPPFLPSPLPETSIEPLQPTSEAIDGPSKQAKVSASLTWTPPMTEALLVLLVDHVRHGLRADTGFKSSTWTAACSAVQPYISQKRVGGGIMQVSQAQCSARQSYLKDAFQEYTALENASGTGFDEATGLITASDEFWAEWIAVSSQYYLNEGSY